MPGGDLDLQDDQGRRDCLWCRSGDPRNWLIKYRAAHGGGEAELSVDERACLKELERENQDLRAETAFLKKASAYFAREQRP